jgi:phage baseplate assembly protein gpV
MLDRTRPLESAVPELDEVIEVVEPNGVTTRRIITAVYEEDTASPKATAALPFLPRKYPIM